MPVGDRQLRLIIDAEVRKARADIDSLRRNINRNAGSMQRSFSGAGVAAVAFGAAVVVAVRDTVRAGAALQRTSVQMEVLAGSIEEGRRRFAELTEFARSVPLTFEAVAGAARQLTAVGVAADEIIPRIRQLGDVTLGNELAFRRLTLQYTQSIAKQRVLLEELNRFTEAGVPIIETLRQVISSVEGTEISYIDLFKTIEAGEVSVDNLNSAFDLLTGSGGRFFGGLERGAETISGQLAKVSDAVQILQFNITTANEGAIFALTNRVITLVDAVSALDPSTFRGITTALGVLLGTLAAFAGVAVSVRAVRALQTAFEGVSTAVRAVSAASPVLRAVSASTRVYTAALDGASLGNSRFAASQLASGTASRSLLVSLRATSAFAAGPYVLAFAAAAGGALLLLHATRDVRREAEFLRQVLADEIEPAEGVDALREQLEQLQEVYQRVQQDAEKFRPGSRGAELAERAMRRLRVEITEVGVALQEVTGTRIISLPQLAATVDLVTEQMRTLNDEIEQLRAADGDTRQIEALVEEYNLAGTELGSLLAIQRELQGIEFLDDADPIRFARNVGSSATEATAAWRTFRDELEGTTSIDLEDIARQLQVGLLTPLEAAREQVRVLEGGLRQLLSVRDEDSGALLFDLGDRSVANLIGPLEDARTELALLTLAADQSVVSLGRGADAAGILRDAIAEAVEAGDQFVRVAGQGGAIQLFSIDEAMQLAQALGDARGQLMAFLEAASEAELIRFSSLVDDSNEAGATYTELLRDQTRRAVDEAADEDLIKLWRLVDDSNTAGSTYADLLRDQTRRAVDEAADEDLIKLWRLVDDSNEAGSTYSELLREQTLRAVDEAADEDLIKLWRLVDDSNEAGATYSELLREQTLRAVDEAADEDLIKLWRLVDDSNEAGATYSELLREQTLRAVDEAADEDLIKLWRLVDDSNEAGATYSELLREQTLRAVDEAADEDLIKLWRLVDDSNEAGATYSELLREQTLRGG